MQCEIDGKFLKPFSNTREAFERITTRSLDQLDLNQTEPEEVRFLNGSKGKHGEKFVVKGCPPFWLYRRKNVIMRLTETNDPVSPRTRTLNLPASVFRNVQIDEITYESIAFYENNEKVFKTSLIGHMPVLNTDMINAKTFCFSLQYKFPNKSMKFEGLICSPESAKKLRKYGHSYGDNNWKDREWLTNLNVPPKISTFGIKFSPMDAYIRNEQMID